MGGSPNQRPQGYNYVTAQARLGRVSPSLCQHRHQRPWFKALTVKLHGGYLSEGETITIVFGDTSQGSSGMQMQTFWSLDLNSRYLLTFVQSDTTTHLQKPQHSYRSRRSNEWKAVLPSSSMQGSFPIWNKSRGQVGQPN
ncbi:MAG: hypothetical protein CM1200mP30_25640 [Pseudomonadota bacterium]|nr:MAG: hypothetical protein CM1200mP30_25640 [Pseudomonadota bacterium]